METLHGKLIDMKDMLDKKAQSHMKQAEKNRSSEKWCNYHLGAAYGYNAAKEELEQLIRHHNWGQETHNSNLTEKDMTQEELKGLIIDWFSHIEQLATDRKTLNGYVMDYQDCLDEIKMIAKNSKDFVEQYFEVL